MKKFTGYEESRKNADYQGSAKLPAGAYVCKVMNVKYEEGKGVSDVIHVQFDITEGEYKDFFMQQYNGNPAEDKKWKGRTSVYVPTDDGSDRDGWTKNTFAKWTKAFEDSNDGYVWDWNEAGWKGKTIGLVFREAGSVINGKEVTYTEVAFPIDADSVRKGTAPKAKFKAKNGYGQQNTRKPGPDSFMAVSGTEEEIPF